MVNIPFGPRTEMPPFTTVYVTPRVGNNVRSGLHDVSDAVRDYAGYARPSHSWQSGGLLWLKIRGPTGAYNIVRGDGGRAARVGVVCAEKKNWSPRWLNTLRSFRGPYKSNPPPFFFYSPFFLNATAAAAVPIFSPATYDASAVLSHVFSLSVPPRVVGYIPQWLRYDDKNYTRTTHVNKFHLTREWRKENNLKKHSREREGLFKTHGFVFFFYFLIRRHYYIDIYTCIRAFDRFSN